MRVNGITHQDLAAYGIHNVGEIVHNPSYELLFKKKRTLHCKGLSVV